MSIRYDDKLNKQILKTVRNFNAKVARLERQGIASPVEKVKVREIKKNFRDRRELESYLRELRKFSQRGVERIAYVDRYDREWSLYEFKVGSIRQRRAIREGERLLAEAKKKHRTEEGIPGPETLMGTDYARNLEANLTKLKESRYNQKTMTASKKASVLRATKRILGSQAFQISIKDNFASHLRILGEAAGLGEDYVDEIIEAIKKVNPRDFERLRATEEIINSIETYYPMWKDARTKQEKAAVGNSVRPFIVSLHDNIQLILADYDEIETKE